MNRISRERGAHFYLGSPGCEFTEVLYRTPPDVSLHRFGAPVKHGLSFDLETDTQFGRFFANAVGRNTSAPR
jgi:hypothetical protein